MFERRSDPLLTRREFFGRLMRCAVARAGIIAASLFIGILGHHALEGFSWLDAFVSASMLLGGMGPVDPVHTAGGKLFAGFSALYCGFAVLASAGIIFAPIVHRFLHRFYLQHGRKD